MGGKLKKVLWNSWTIGIGGSIIGGLALSWITAMARKVNLWEGFIAVVTWIWRAIVAVITFRVPVWIILIAVGMVILIGKAIFNARKADAEETRSSFRAYTKDKIKFWVFEWEYLSGGDGEPDSIRRLRPVCEECFCDLLLDEHDRLYGIYRLYCPNCRREYPNVSHSAKSEIEQIIIHRVKSKEYQNSLYFKREQEAKNEI